MTHPYSIYVWLSQLSAHGEGHWSEPAQCFTEQWALYIVVLMHPDSRAVIKIVRYGLNLTCFPDEHAVELVEHQTANQRERHENEELPASYLDFLPLLRSVYVVDIAISKQQRLSFPRKVVASLYFLNVFSRMPASMFFDTAPSPPTGLDDDPHNLHKLVQSCKNCSSRPELLVHFAPNVTLAMIGISYTHYLEYSDLNWSGAIKLICTS